MSRTISLIVCSAILALLTSASDLLAQTTVGNGTGVDTNGVDQTVGTTGTGNTTTVTPDTTGTTGTGTTGTGTTGTGTSSDVPLTPPNSAKKTVSYNNMKAQALSFQAIANGSTSATATGTTTTSDDLFKTVFLIPFIQNFFTQLQTFLAAYFANQIGTGGSGGGSSTSSPA